MIILLKLDQPQIKLVKKGNDMHLRFHTSFRNAQRMNKGKKKGREKILFVCSKKYGE